MLTASRFGLPVSTTHALTGALIGAGTLAAGVSGVKFTALEKGILLPLLSSPIIALVLTLLLHPLVKRTGQLVAGRDCVCLEAACSDRPALANGVPLGNEMAMADRSGGNTSRSLAFANPAGNLSAPSSLATPALRFAHASECQTGRELARFSVPDAFHWLSGAAISFARGMNDTPKIAAVLMIGSSALATGGGFSVPLVATAMALGGILGARKVAHTMSREITPMPAAEAVTANLVAATLVTLASPYGLPVSTTQVVSGGIFGIGLTRRHEADWSRVRDILLSWAGTLPLAAFVAAFLYALLSRI